MDLSFIQPLLDWLANHPNWANAIIFLVAMAESLLIVGIIVPGAIIMLSAGALIAVGTLDFWSCMLFAILGAIVGDGLSYFIGYRYKDQLRGIWPFRSHPALISRGEAYFFQHGGKSIFFGRFVGPVRAVIPAIAGMLGVPPVRFFVINVVSAVAWAPAYLLPGIAFGASLKLAAEVATRLVIVLAVSIALLWLSIWLVRRVFLFLQPRANAMATQILDWSRAHPRLGVAFTAVLDPQKPESRGLAILAAVLVIAAFLFLEIIENILSDAPLRRVDQAIYRFFLGLRTPWADQIMVFVSELGDASVNIPLSLGILLWLMWRRHWFAAVHWLAAVAFGAAVSASLKQYLSIPRPNNVYEGLATFAFPSGHATISMVIYGFLAVIIARELRGPMRWIPYAVSTAFIAAIALSRLYLGAHWLSDVLGGLTLGLAWVALLGIAYRRHATPHISVAGLISVAAIVLVVAGTWHISQHHQRELQRYAPQPDTTFFDASEWWSDQWQTLPAYRIDFEGEFEEPLVLQWAGKIHDLENYLLTRGWQRPVPLTFSTTLHWLQPTPPIATLPLLPHAHNGRHEALILTLPDTQNRQIVMRLWPADIRLSSSNTPIWMGSVAYQHLTDLSLFTVPRSEPKPELALQRFTEFLDGVEWKAEVREKVAANKDNIAWSHKVLLIKEKSNEK